jgi:predicted Rdx family selenoprotein
MLRAAYFGQELLSTFNTSIGEIALIPATGGVFTIHLTYVPTDVSESNDTTVPLSPKEVLLWDRKTEGFPDVKILKQRVRDHIDPARSLGHVDKPSISSKTTKPPGVTQGSSSDGIKSAEMCTDCA